MDPVAKALLSRGGKQAELRAWQPGWMDTARHAVADALRPVFGGDGRRSQAYVDDKIKPTAEYLPGVGDAMAVGEARDAFSQGNYLGGGLLAAGAAMGLLPGVGDVAQKGIKSLVKSRGDEVLGLLKAGRAEEVTDDMLDMGNAADNANLNAYLFENYDLPMDKASRMARAREIANSESDLANLYHATAQDFDKFDPKAFGSGMNYAAKSEPAVFTTTSPQNAETYLGQQWAASTGENVIKEYGGATNLKNGQDVTTVFDQGSQIMPLHDTGIGNYDWWQGGAYDAEEMHQMLKDAKKQGMDGVVRQNFVDPGVFVLGRAPRATTVASMKPENIRSRFARFDPRLKHLRNLSAGVGGLGLLGVGAMQDNEAVY